MKRLATGLTDLLRKDGPGGFAKVIATLTQVYNWPEDTSVVHQMAALTRSITPAKLVPLLLTIASNEVLIVIKKTMLIIYLCQFDWCHKISLIFKDIGAKEVIIISITSC